VIRLDDDRWRKASQSTDSGACVEVHPAGAVRDSKSPAGPMLRFAKWAALAALVDLVR
jgi:hypothetical protein